MSRILKTSLKSGIKVITEEMSESESSSIGVWVKTGSRDEDPEFNGASHFIEHMLFKGTATRSAHDISKEIESVGGVLNAFTSREYTCFYAKVLNRDIPRAVDILSDILLNSKFDRRELVKERKVIMQEIKMVEDTPDDLIHDLFAEKFYKAHPLGRPILGTMETISSLDRPRLVDYFKKKYVSESIFITAAGGVRHSSLVKLLRSTFGKVEKSGGGEAVEKPEASAGACLVEKDLGQVHICIGVPVPPQSDPGRYRTYLLNTILGAGMSSRLFQKIREKRGLVYSVYSYLSLFRDTGALTVYAGTTEENFSKVVKLILGEFRNIGKDITASELKDAKSHLKGSMLLGLEASDNRMAKLAKDEIYFKEVVPVKEMVKGIDRVRTRDLKFTASKFLVPEKAALVAMGKVGSARLPAFLKKTV
ncbi:MAG: pitrilysin family protein [Thermodesulfobacteriota bacterium]|nr:MAG: pitrilysin family protein [Thermodesulfobacteriota bacterium]